MPLRHRGVYRRSPLHPISSARQHRVRHGSPRPIALLLLLLLLLPATGPAAVVAPFFSHDKESPEPFGAGLELVPPGPPDSVGVIAPEDPPAVLAPGPQGLPRFGPGGRALEVETTVDQTAYSWFGTITVSALVRLDGSPVADCDSVIALSAANPRVRARLRDDGAAPDLAAGDGRYTGLFEIGAGEGEARPTGSYTVTATAWRGADSGSDPSSTFSLYSVRRWTGITTTAVADPAEQYTDFFVVPQGGGYRHTIRDLGLVRSVAASAAQIRIPILPRENSISNLTVTGSGVSGVGVRDNVIEFTCNLSSSVTRVTIAFDAPSDLAATRIDRYHTGDIALRDFRNGYLVWNRYIHTAILGSGFTSPHGPGCVVDQHVTDLVTGDAHTIDCMERVAIHLDNAAFNDGTGTYPSNIKWSGDALSWWQDGDLERLTFAFTSGGNYGLQSKIAVDRTVEFFAGARWFRHHYVMRNVDAGAHDFDFVWGKEQWLYGSAAGSDRDEDDRGFLPGDPAAWGGEYAFSGPAIEGTWFGAFDLSSFYSIAVLWTAPSAQAAPIYAYFLCDPPLGNSTGEYPIYPSGSCADMPNTFFEKRIGVLAPGQAAEVEFYQWGGYGATRDALTAVLEADAEAVAGGALSVEPGPGGGEGSGDPHLDLAGRPLELTVAPSPFAVGTAITFDLPARGGVTLRLYDAGGRMVQSLVDHVLPAGRHVVRWDGVDAAGRPLAGGVYFCLLEQGGRRAVGRVVIGR